MKVVVLGAGVVGITTAYYLLKAGHTVEILERNAEAGQETSFANGAQLCYSAIRSIRKFPPGHPPTTRQAAFINKYTYKNKLFTEAKPELLKLVKELNLEFDLNLNGVLNLFFSEYEFKRHCRIYKNKCEYNIKATILSPAECKALHPELTDNLVGGLIIQGDGVGDAYKFTKQVAQTCKNLAIKFNYNTSVLRLISDSKNIIGVETNRGIIKGDAFVVALGAYSGEFLKDAKVKNDIFPNKGYSISFDNPMPEISLRLADPVAKIYLTTLGNKIRVAGLSESVWFDSHISYEQIQKLILKVNEILPNMKIGEYKSWSCFRSSTKSSTPIIAKSNKFPNLYINSGHGGFGWTLAPISAKRIVGLLSL
jgi:D-amino-acid dehydrogenase